MKKTITFLFATGLILTSCMKKHTCQCFDKTGFSPGPSSQSTTNKSTADKFKSDCEAADVAQKKLGGYCEYK